MSRRSTRRQKDSSGSSAAGHLSRHFLRRAESRRATEHPGGRDDLGPPTRPLLGTVAPGELYYNPNHDGGNLNGWFSLKANSSFGAITDSDPDPDPTLVAANTQSNISCHPSSTAKELYYSTVPHLGTSTKEGDNTAANAKNAEISPAPGISLEIQSQIAPSGRRIIRLNIKHESGDRFIPIFAAIDSQSSLSFLSWEMAVQLQLGLKDVKPVAPSLGQNVILSEWAGLIHCTIYADKLMIENESRGIKQTSVQVLVAFIGADLDFIIGTHLASKLGLSRNGSGPGRASQPPNNDGNGSTRNFQSPQRKLPPPTYAPTIGDASTSYQTSGQLQASSGGAVPTLSRGTTSDSAPQNCGLHPEHSMPESGLLPSTPGCVPQATPSQYTFATTEDGATKATGSGYPTFPTPRFSSDTWANVNTTNYWPFQETPAIFGQEDLAFLGNGINQGAF